MMVNRGAGIIYCEMVKMDPLVRHDLETYRLLDYEQGMHPIGAQLCGSKPELAGKSARILEEMGFDVIDLNCGCPVDKVTKDGSGSGMLRDLGRIGDVLSNLVSAVKIPVTIKIRAGWDENSIIVKEVATLAEQTGAKAITIHARTREQGYQGKANWDWIRLGKESVKEIAVIGSGDLFTAEDAERMFAYTGCDGILMARGLFGAPWIIEDVHRQLSKKPPLTRTGVDYRDALLQHCEYVQKYHSPRRAALHLRRIGCWYLKKSQGTRRLKEELNRSKSVEEIHALILSYPWHETHFSTSETGERGGMPANEGV